MSATKPETKVRCCEPFGFLQRMARRTEAERARDAEWEARVSLRIAAEQWYRAKNYGGREDREKAGAALETFSVLYAEWAGAKTSDSEPRHSPNEKAHGSAGRAHG